MKKRYDVVIGFVGHTEIDLLPQIKHAVENISGFNLIFFKTSSNKLKLVEDSYGI
jgi:hypothetical protein